MAVSSAMLLRVRRPVAAAVAAVAAVAAAATSRRCCRRSVRAARASSMRWPAVLGSGRWLSRRAAMAMATPTPPPPAEGRWADGAMAVCCAAPRTERRSRVGCRSGG
eukprot:3590591-Prymnesium_polylepis.1